MTITARPSPCASCPYRRNVPSGVWAAEEYDKLRSYDGDMAQQLERGGLAVFLCHQNGTDGNQACSGWLGHREPSEMLAVRLGISAGHLDPACAEYTTSVELFGSGDAAAQHGEHEIEQPSGDAAATISKIVRKRGLTPYTLTPTGENNA